MGQKLTKLFIHVNIDKVYKGIVTRHFSQICNRPLIDTRIMFFLNILRKN